MATRSAEAVRATIDTWKDRVQAAGVDPDEMLEVLKHGHSAVRTTAQCCTKMGGCEQAGIRAGVCRRVCARARVVTIGRGRPPTTHAAGWPGLDPRWTSSAKSGVGTAYDSRSRVWFTISHGIID